MDIRSWQWTTVLIVSIGYWVLLAIGWLIYTTRPATQARARARDLESVSHNLDTGEVTLAFTHTARLDRVALALFAPPVVLAAVWMVLRSG